MIDRIYHFWPLLVGLVGFVSAMAVTVHAVLWKRDTSAVIAWVGLAWLTPILGPLIYLCFGVNRIQRKAISLRFRQHPAVGKSVPLTAEQQRARDDAISIAPGLPGLSRLATRVTGRALLSGNSVQPLINGDEAFPAMLESIDRAERSVALLSYIFDADRSGRQFLDALIRAKDRGVSVRVLIDHVGARYSRPNMVSLLQHAGVPAAGFLPTRAPRLTKYANLRNHRKILVVDGKWGFTGGTNIREGHCLRLNPKHPVQCVHFRLEGPVIAHLREAFAIDWAFATGETLEGDRWFPTSEQIGPIWARGIHDGPDEDFGKINDILLGALASAHRTVRIVTPYFLPHSALIQAMNVTALRGVSVDILVPAKSNLAFVQWASTALFWALLEKGCRIHLTDPPFDHTKLMIVDDVWSLIGSTNWDARSLRLNFEFNVECYDSVLARQLNQVIDEKLLQSREITLEEVDGRSMPIQLRDGLSRLLTPYL